MIKTKNNFAMKVVAMVLAITMIIGTIPSGIATVFANESDAVAKIGDKEYASLEAALADVPVGNSKETPAEATVIELCQDTAHSFDVGISNGTKPKNIELRLNDNTLTLKPAVGSTGTVSNGIRVLAYSKLTITNGNIVCSSEEDDNVKVGIANYGEVILDGVNVQSGALTRYTVNNRGELTLKGDTIVQNGQVAPNDYSDSTGLVAITNDPYDLYYSTPMNATINCDSENVVVGNIQIERYEIAKNHEKGNNVLNISEGSFGSIVIPEEASDTGIDVVGNITGGSFEAASGVELQNVMDLTVAGVAYQTPEKAVSIKLTDNLENGFDVGVSNGTAPKYFKLDLNQNTITLRPAVGSVGTVSSGIRVLAYSKLEIKNGEVVCSDTLEDNVKVGIANYGTLVLDSVDVKAGALTKYTINNRGELTLSGTTTVENAKVAHGDYSTGSTYVAITNDPYTLYYTNDAVINCDSKDVVVGNVQLETYSSAGNVKLNISEGSFGEVVAPTVSENDKVEILGNITGGKYASDVSDYVASDYNVSFDNDTYTVAQKLEQDNFGFETPVPLDQWVGETYTNKVTGVQGTGTTTYSVVAGEDVATVNATTGEVTFLKLGTVTIQADNTGDSEYLGASAKYSVTSVKKGQEAFKFATTGPIEVDWDLNGTYQNTVTGGSGDGEVSYKILENNGVATIDSETGVVTFIKAGEITIQATKASDDKYFSIDTTYILKISKVEQDELKAEADSIITYSPEWQAVIEVSGGSGNGNYKFELPNDYSEYAEINPNTGAIKTKRYGTIKVLVSKEGDDCYNATKNYEVVIEIKRAEQSNFKFAVEAPNSITYGENNNSFTNLASGGQTTNNPTYAITGDAATVDAITGELTIVKAGTVTITATKLGDNCYDAIEATYTLEIKHAQQSFAFEEGQEVSETYGIHEFVNEIIDEVGTGAITFEIVSGDDIGATIDENTGVITFEDSELRVGEISVLATKAGNECYKAFELGYTLEISYLTVGNDVRPTLSGDTKNSSGWYTGDVTFTAPTGYQISMANTLDVSNVWDDSVTYDTEGVNDVNLYLMNAEGYITDAITFEDVKIDKKSPEKLEVKYSASIKDVILETITFGIFEAKTVDVTITVADSTSGIDTLTYDYGDGVVSVLAEDLAVDGTYKFTIDKDLRHKVEVEVSDIAGNTTVYDDDTTYVLDLTKPGFEVTYEYDSGSANIDNDIIYTQGKTTFKFKITEENYDLAKKEGVVPVVKYDNVPTSLEWTFDETTKVVTASLPVSASGDHVVTVEYTDLSDNQMDTYSKEIHIDSTVPVIDVSYNNNEVRNDINYKADRTATVKITEHNFKADEVVLTVTAEDINGNSVDITSKGYADYAKNPANWNTVGDVHTLKTDGMKFDIEAIYSVKLEYTDLAKNEAEAYETDFVVDKTDAGNIKIEYSTSVLDEVIEGITFGFYKAPVTITVTAEDETAGVEYFELTYIKEAGASNVNTDTYKTEKLTAVQDAEDKSVFTATHTIPAQARGSVSVDVMDRAGNDSTKADTDKVVIVDDVTAELSAKYTFTDDQSREYNDIYYTQGETKVTFTIDEANFDVASKPVVTVNEETREVTWSQTTGTDKWVGEITLTGNDDYAIKVTFADKSGNAMNTYEKTVHIDNAAPEFDVTYDNNEARNDNNYKADRIATVKITEHNFKADEVVLTIAAEDINGNPVDISAKAYADYAKNPTNWNTTGDVHTLKIDGMKFDIEAIYSVKLEYTDLAENVAEVYETEFVVDKTDAGNIKIEYSTSVLDEIIEGITFGFYKAPVTVTVTAEDETAGVEYFELTYTKEAGASNVNTDTYKTEKLIAVQDVEDKSVFTATHTIPAQARGSVSVNVMDRAGNDSAKADTKMLVVDDISPTRKVEYANAVVLNRATMTPVDSYEEDDVVILYYETEAEVTITINEANFYKEDVKVSVTKNGVENVQDVTWTDESVDVHVGKFTLSGDGDYFVKVTYTDRSGNVMKDYVADEYKSQEIRIDNTDPTTSVEYSSDAEPVNVKYYKADRKAVITIVDHNFLADDVVATVTAKNVQNKDIANAEEIAKNFADYLRNRDSWTHSGDVHTAEITFTEDAQYTFKIDYKDIVGNPAATYEADPFVVDHKAPTDAVTVEYKTPIIEKVISAITFGFYNPSMTVVITADDITSGVDYFEWIYNQEADTSTEKNVATESGKISTGDITYSDEGKTATASFALNADEAKQYRGNITFTATDRAGNTSGEYQDTDDISIVDTISPTINVTYAAKETGTMVHYVDKNLVDINSVEEFKTNGYQAFYDGNVVATIQINEANFFEGIKTDDDEVIHEVGILLVKTYDDGSEQKVEFLPEGSVQKYPEASVQNIEWKQDGDTYSYDIPYDEEADYELTVEYVDFSNNNASVSADDSNSFEDVKTYTSKIITVDKTAPIVAVTYGNKNIKNTVDGRQYFDAEQSATITVEEHNFRADDFDATIVAKDVCGEDVTVEDFAKTLATRENWKKNGNVYTIEIEYPVDANYTFDYEYEDLAQNNAAEYKEDVFTVDKTAPKNLKVTYSTSVLEKILESITFGYYNAEMTVTISAEDETAGIHYFVYSYIKDSGVSDVNAELLNEVIKNANENIKQNGKVFTTEFKIPKLALGNDNQFNGTVKFTAYDRAENNTEKVDNHRIVVDNIKPTIVVTYNNPVQTVNNISYYAGNIEGTIVINEANFYSEDVKIVITKDGSQTVVNVKWVDNSVDVHTGTFTLTEDGDYIVSVEYKDRSSNAMDTYTSNRLTLDTKAPTVNVTNIKNNSANKDEKYSFTITANDTNLNAESFKPVLTAVVRGEDGSYSTKTISLGDVTTVEAGKTYSYTINNLEEDAVYSLVCSLKDMSENAYSKIVLSDGKEYEEVRFSINRNGSTFAINENTEKLVNQYYVYSVDEDVVIEEVNVDPIEDYVVKLNGKTLTEGTDYKTSLSDKAGEWSKRTYTISKSLFEKEGEYSIVVESTDKADTTAYSDVKDLDVLFVVDQTKPVVTISGLETSGRYQVEEQVVTIMPTDDGGRLNSIKVVLMDSDGKEISVLFEMSGEELLNYLVEHDGKITFVVPEGLENKVQIICNDCAANAAGDTNEYNEIFERVTVSQSTWVIYYANKPLFYGTIAGVLALVAGCATLIVLKRRKKEENS